MTSEQKVLLNRIRVCGFVRHETALFLDTHPDNQDALTMFQKHNEMYREATYQYAEQFGPLEACDFPGGSRWTWVDGPWPWEMEEE